MPGKIAFDMFECVKINYDVVFVAEYDRYEIDKC